MASQEKERTWEIVQKKAFTAWVNSYLERRNLNIEDLTQDFADGVKLINFVELLSNKTVKSRWDRNPRMKVQMIENVNIAIKFIQNDLSVRLVGVGAEDFVDGNLKLILGFLWTLFRKFRTDNVEGDADGGEAASKASGMLQWCRQITEGYKGINVSDYKSTFQNGLAYLAMIHKYAPDAVDYNKYSADNALENLVEAFDLADKILHIPKLIDPQELIDKTADERALSLYLSLFYHAYASKEEREKLELEKRRAAGQLQDEATSVDKAREERAELERKQKDLENTSSSLKDDLERKSERLHQLEAIAAQTRKDLADVHEQLNSSKSEKDKKFADLTAEFEKLKLAVKKKEVDDTRASEENKSRETEEVNATIEKEKQATEDLKTELQQTKSKLEEDIQNYHKNIAEDQQKIKEIEEAIEEAKKKQATDVAGFQSVKAQLDAHLAQLGRWRAVLGYGADEFDSDTVQTKVLDKISEKPFEQQLDYLAKKLNSETSKISALEKEKLAALPAK